jgi:uncharacterized protein with ParB-like and HNH nuclease domain
MTEVIEQDDLVLETDESEEEEAYVIFDVATYPSDNTLQGIVDMVARKDIEIPDFQRAFVWTIKQSSLLIESFLLGLPVPPVFFYVDEESKSLVIDGHQRIMSVVFYFEGLFGAETAHGKRQVFRLEGLNKSSPFYKKTFAELSQADQRKLCNQSTLRAINIRQISPVGESTVKYHIFSRLNTTGTPLKSQEIRNAVFKGEIVQILRDLNDDKNWRLILGKTNHIKHQVDVELVLRVLALVSGFSKYERPMKEFLNKAMQKNRKGNTPEVLKFRESFPNAAKIILQNLGEKPFHIRGRLNASVLDSVFYTMIRYNDKIPADLSLRYSLLIQDEKFEKLTTTGTTDISVVKGRFELVKEYLVGKQNGLYR